MYKSHIEYEARHTCVAGTESLCGKRETERQDEVRAVVKILISLLEH